MPLNKSKSKQAFQENVKAELSAGKPLKQSLAIAYATKGEHKMEHKTAHHSSHSEKRSEHYHSVVVGKTDSGATKMTRRVGQKDNLEESDEKL